MKRADRSDAQRINHAWNAFVRGGAGCDDDGISQTLVRLHAHDDTPHVDPAFTNRLLNQLIARHPTTSSSAESHIHQERSDTVHLIQDASQPIGWPRQSPRQHRDSPVAAWYRAGWTDLIAIAAVVLLIFGSVMADRNRSSIERFPTESGFQLAATPGSESTRDASVPAMYRGNAARTGEVPGPGPTGMPTLAWKTSAKDGLSQVLMSANKRVFSTAFSAQTQTLDLIAVDLETGEDLWRAPIDVDSASVPAVANGLVYVMTSTGLKAIEEDTGAVAWTYPLEAGPPSGSPVVHEGVVYFAGADYSMYAVDAVNAKSVWKVPLPGNAPADGFTVGAMNLAVSGDKVFGRGADGLVFALKTADGEDVWTTILEGGSDEPFLVSDGVLAVTAIEFTGQESPRPVWLHALDAASGDPIWEPLELTSPSSLTAAGGALYVADTITESGTIDAYDIRTGEPLWTSKIGGALTSPAYVDGQLYVLSMSDGIIRRIDASTGASNWSVYLGARGNPLVVDGLLIAGGYQTIYAVAGGEQIGTPAPTEEPVDLSGLPACEPPRTPPTKPLTGKPNATIDAETRVIESLGTPSVTIDGRPIETTNWPHNLASNVPSGEQASPEQTARAQETIAAMAACSQRPGSESQIAGFFSDDFFRRGIVTPGSGEVLTWGIQPDEEQLRFLDVFVLEDGRVAASAVSETDVGTLLVFVEEGGVWLVDEVYGVTPEYPVSA